MLRSISKGLALLGLVIALLLGITGYRALKNKPIFKVYPVYISHSLVSSI